MKLDIGAGANRYAADYTTVDLYNTKADIIATMWQLPIADNSVETIWADACLEHIARPMIQPTLKEWHRVLQHGGTAVISVPDLDWVCRYWLETPRYGAHGFLFGNQADEGDFHRSGWNVEWLWMDLEDAGLGMIKVERVFSHGQEMLRATCIKPPAEEALVRSGYFYIAPDDAMKAEYSRLLSEMPYPYGGSPAQ